MFIILESEEKGSIFCVVDLTRHALTNVLLDLCSRQLYKQQQRQFDLRLFFQCFFHDKRTAYAYAYAYVASGRMPAKVNFNDNNN